VFDVAGFVASAGPAIGCSQAFCVGALSTDDFVTLALRHRELTLEGPGCSRCATNRASVTARIEVANSLLSAGGLPGRVVMVMKPGAAALAVAKEPSAAAPSRRALLRKLVPSLEPEPVRTLALEPMGRGALEPAKLRAQALPVRRERLLEQLHPRKTPPAPSLLGEPEVDLSSEKRLNLETCTGCMQCVSVCPTGALTTPRAQDELVFESARCVKCRSCHDVCEPSALTVAPRFDVSAFVNRAQVSLGRFSVKACSECGARFKYDGGDVLCARCAGHDAEARELHGLPPASPGVRS
jgi:ferredoxin